jgi:hypothetical protein
VLLVADENRQGLEAVTKALGDAGISVGFLMAQMVGFRCRGTRLQGRPTPALYELNAIASTTKPVNERA